MRKYYSGITLFKLIGSLLVLFGHVRLPLLYLRLGEQLPGLAAAMAFVVPCFYCISGFLAYRGWTGAARPDRYVRRYLLWLGGMYLSFCGLAILNGAARPWHWPLKSAVLPVFQFLCVVGPYASLWFVPPLLFSVAVVYWGTRTGQLRLVFGLAVGGFVVAQLASGTFGTVLSWLLGPLPVYQLRYYGLFSNAIASYFGIGFPFVLAGVLLARHEARFVALPGRWLAACALGSLALELPLLHYAAPSLSGGPRLVWSMVPLGCWLFYGVLRIRLAGIQRHHTFINRFSIVLYFLHLLLIDANVALLGWSRYNITASQSAVCVLLTAAEAWLLTLALSAYLSRTRPAAATLGGGPPAAQPQTSPAGYPA